MLCINPFRRASFEHGCGQCLPCRINRKRTWSGRICLEALAYDQSSFVTLTYNDECLPASGSLSDDHWREFTNGIGYRYFGCGEYGDKFGRPHYHLVLFGLPVLEAEDFCKGRWPYGFVCARPFSFEHGSYVASYAVKKMTREGDSRLREGCRPEFARMSRRPAIGTPGIAPFQEWLNTREGVAFLAENLDVPSVVSINGRRYPLGRTMVQKMREVCDMPSDLPARTERRILRYKLSKLDPKVVEIRERRRVTVYERQKALLRRGRGTL